MLRTMTFRHFVEWVEFAKLEPFDETRQDYRTASIVQMIANMNRDSKRHPQPFPLADFVLQFGDEAKPKKKKQTWQEQKLIAQMLTSLHNE